MYRRYIHHYISMDTPAVFHFCDKLFYRAVVMCVIAPHIRFASWLIPMTRTVTREPLGGLPRLGYEQRQSIYQNTLPGLELRCCVNAALVTEFAERNIYVIGITAIIPSQRRSLLISI